jgi:hypothetical protein
MGLGLLQLWQARSFVASQSIFDAEPYINKQLNRHARDLQIVGLPVKLLPHPGINC